MEDSQLGIRGKTEIRKACFFQGGFLKCDNI